MSKVIDFSQHGKIQSLISMQDRDWAHVQVSERQVTFDGTIHNLNSSLQIQMTVPKHYFGEAKNDLNDAHEKLSTKMSKQI